MSLQDELDALRAEFVRSAPPGRAALYDAKVDELRRTFPIEKALKTGDHAPDFTLPNPSGRAVSLSALLRTPWRMRFAAMSAWRSENVRTRSGFRARILSMFADVKALTRGFSRRACGGRTT